MQIQFKKNKRQLDDIEDLIVKELEEELESNEKLVNDANYPSAKSLKGVIQLTRDSLQQKRMNLLGCKMKIYQERLRQIQFLEILSRFKDLNHYENIYDMDQTNLANKLYFCQQMSLKVKKSIEKSREEIQ